MLDIRKANQRGSADHGWLKSHHTFSFAGYFDPKQIGFSDLLVINDDYIAGGGGFGTHPHHDMEIFTYVLSGQLAHKDSMGNGSVILPGDVQVMSAGTGVRHSEFNHSPSETVHLLQIWLVPNKTGVAPSYQQKHFSKEEKQGKLCLIISPDGKSGSLTVHQDVKVWSGLLNGKERFGYEIGQGRNGYVHVARGTLTLNDEILHDGDGVRVRGAGKLDFTAGSDAEVLLFDLAGKELPSKS